MNQLNNTSAIIAVKSGDEYRSVSVFYGGHPSICGEALLRRYNRFDLASKLIDLGDLRSIDRQGKVETYADNGLSGFEAVVSDREGVYRRLDADSPFCYIWDGEWWFHDISGRTERLADNLWLAGDAAAHDAETDWAEVRQHDE